MQNGKAQVLGVSNPPHAADWRRAHYCQSKASPGYESGTGQGVLVPRGTPEAVVQKLSKGAHHSAREILARAWRARGQWSPAAPADQFFTVATWARGAPLPL